MQAPQPVMMTTRYARNIAFTVAQYPLHAPDKRTGGHVWRAVTRSRMPLDRRGRRASRRKGHGMAGIGLGGILVIVGIVLAIVWSLWIGIIVALIGLIAFGGFAKGKWY